MAISVISVPSCVHPKQRGQPARAQNRDLKVLLMSATINAARFSTYFGGCATLSVEGRLFPVQDFCLGEWWALLATVKAHPLLKESVMPESLSTGNQFQCEDVVQSRAHLSQRGLLEPKGCFFSALSHPGNQHFCLPSGWFLRRKIGLNKRPQMPF